ncbi:small GTP-binding protein [Desulfobaculum xiamenense]|uniref:Small GTP-binding protein n=1 Tax=Desulfobaculum xiamenense TaxID=995050 RepID=A0A846QT96_9BACT|nr:GTP-binding protein [Desulfobaculum xiamenense]NJB68685.1 small GTP-binding protein [Desulfobaculum xiamenense]
MSAANRNAQSRPLAAVVVGDVDHGKSTLIGRLLYDTGSLDSERMSDLESSIGAGGPDFARVMDALAEERRDRITVDTAQTFFSSAVRDYVLIDVPGHREFIRNMVTGATKADLAVAIVDVERGMGDQTMRHLAILNMIGVQRWVVVVNKMDLPGQGEKTFETVAASVRALAKRLGSEVAALIPVSAVRGDNVVHPSSDVNWYRGPSLLAALDAESVPGERRGTACMPVQDSYDMDGTPVRVGRMLSGSVTAGTRLRVEPGGGEVEVAHVVRFPEGVVERAEPGESVGLVLAGDASIRRGDVLADAPLRVESSVRVRMASLCEKPLRIGETFTMRIGHQEMECTLGELTRRVVFGGEIMVVDENPGRAVFFGDIVVGNMMARNPVAFLPFAQCPELGRLVLERGGEAVAVGVVE